MNLRKLYEQSGLQPLWLNLLKIKKSLRNLKWLLFDLRNFTIRQQLVFISEPTNWVIKEIAQSVAYYLKRQGLISATVRFRPRFLKNKIIHFGSAATLQKKYKPDKSNKIIVTWYHFVNDERYLKMLGYVRDQTDLVHTPASPTKQYLQKYGVSADKIVVIPEGIDLNLFSAVDQDRKRKIRQELGLPVDSFVIGSFQKDGEGWGEGMQPKLIKGPDVFCAVVERLAKKYPIHVLLTGPARGYVKDRLKKAGVNHTHHFLDEYRQVVRYFQALDLYIIGSRIEGGPMAILEAWATGVPVVSTKVGQVPDIASHGHNALLSEIDDVASLTSNAEQLITDPHLGQKLRKNGLATVRRHGWNNIVSEYYNKLYKPLLSK